MLSIHRMMGAACYSSIPKLLLLCTFIFVCSYQSPKVYSSQSLSSPLKFNIYAVDSIGFTIYQFTVNSRDQIIRLVPDRVNLTEANRLLVDNSAHCLIASFGQTVRTPGIQPYRIDSKGVLTKSAKPLSMESGEVILGMAYLPNTSYLFIRTVSTSNTGKSKSLKSWLRQYKILSNHSIFLIRKISWKDVSNGEDSLVADPLGRFIYSVDSEKVHVFSVSRSHSGMVQHLSDIPISPSGFAVDPNGKFIYFVTSKGLYVSTLSKSGIHTPEAVKGKAAQLITEPLVIEPYGVYGYASLRGHDLPQRFRIDSSYHVTALGNSGLFEDGLRTICFVKSSRSAVANNGNSLALYSIAASGRMRKVSTSAPLDGIPNQSVVFSR